jgi:hypothetical protein
VHFAKSERELFHSQNGELLCSRSVNSHPPIN